MLHYSKSTKTHGKCPKVLDTSPLLQLPLDLISQSKYALNEWIEQDPTIWSSPSKKQHIEVLKTVKVQLTYAYLIDLKHQMMQFRLRKDQKQWINSWKSLHKGGAISVIAVREKKSNCDKKRQQDLKNRDCYQTTN